MKLFAFEYYDVIKPASLPQAATGVILNGAKGPIKSEEEHPFVFQCDIIECMMDI